MIETERIHLLYLTLFREPGVGSHTRHVSTNMIG